MTETQDIALETEEWFEQLRHRFVAVARRRVPAEAVEDVVQEALAVVFEKGIKIPASGPVEGLPPLAWCFQVLRNVLGNFYQKARTRAGTTSDAEVDTLDAADGRPTPLESLQSKEAASLIRDGLRELARIDEVCCRYLQRLLDGLAPADLAAEEDIGAAVLYRRVYRCRGKLRDILESRGVLA
jgi:DNA-directed RNA polymerase specialized sigma24 family protein